MSGIDEKRVMLRRYLLGGLPELEASHLAEQYFVDEDLFDQLLEVESELLDQYVSGRLSPEERKSFGEYLRSLPDGEVKLATAFVLREAAGKAPAMAPVSSGAVVPISPSSTWSMFKEWLLGGGPVLRYASAAIGLVLLAGLAYLVVTQRQLRRDVAQLRVERAQTELEKARLSRDTQAGQQEQAAQRARIRQLELQLAQERARQAEEISQRGEGVGAVLASLILTPSLRSSGAPDVLTLAATVKTVSFSMPVVDREQITNYRATLQTSEGQVILTRKGLRPQASRRGQSVTLRLPAARLTGDNFKLTLQGTAADGIEIARDFYFKIVRK